MDIKYIEREIREMTSETLCKELNKSVRGSGYRFTATEQYVTEAARRIAELEKELAVARKEIESLCVR